MHSIIFLLVVTLLVIAGAAILAPKLKVPAPLILVAAGIGVGFLSVTPDVKVDPQVILLGLLPPVLYASATSIPVMNLRRNFTAINGLSVVLVVLSSLGLGALFVWLIPGLTYPYGVALGAILSPTDAVATSIFKGRGVPGRVAVLLDGESLLNDASALIVLRTALVATSVGFSMWDTLGSFVLSIAVAVGVGVAAARILLEVRCRVEEEAINTVLSFTAPFLAAVPAEMLHGSGLVAAVVAGFVTAIRAPRFLPPGHRLSDAENWATLEIVFEGLIFLTMGLTLSATLRQMADEPDGIRRGLIIAALALAATVILRAGYVIPLLWRLGQHARRVTAGQSRFDAMQNELMARGHDASEPIPSRWGLTDGDVLRRLVVPVRRYFAYMEYLAREPLGRAEAALMIWAGMRGAVTVAAAQLLPDETPHRPLLIFIAFAVATMSLLIQGGSIGLLVRLLFPATPGAAAQQFRQQEKAKVRLFLDDIATRVPRETHMSDADHRLAVLRRQRLRLLDARDHGIFDADALARALLDVDVDELVIALREENG
jgi:CPA1 family monovalent cation:H+ antiporter